MLEPQQRQMDHPEQRQNTRTDAHMERGLLPAELS